MIVTKEQFDEFLSDKDYTIKEIKLRSPRIVDITEYFVNGEKVAIKAEPLNEPVVYQII